MASYFWQGAAGSAGNWNNPANWTNNHVPGAGDTAVDFVPNTTIDVTDFERAQYLILSASGALLDLTSASSTLLVNNLFDTGSNIVVNGGFLDGITMALSGGTLTMSNGATVGFNSATIGSDFTVIGNGSFGDPASNLSGSGTIDASGGILNINGIVRDVGSTSPVFGFSGTGSELRFTGRAAVQNSISLASGNTVAVTGSLSIATTETVTGGEMLVTGGIITDAAGIDLSTGASMLIGHGTVTAPLSGPGTVDAQGGTLQINDSIPSQTNFEITNDGSVLRITGPTGSGSIVRFDSNASSGDGTLWITQPINNGQFQGTLDNFVTGDTLEVFDNNGFITSATYSGGFIHIFSDTKQIAQIADLNDPGGLTVHQLGGGLVAITASAVPCFLRGTAILTPHGEMPVEMLEVGDHVTTQSGERKRLRWIGVGRTLVTPFNSERCAPVVVRRGALAENVPHRDLYVTRGHSLFIDGYLVPVEELINHRTIAWVREPQVIEYYHLELEHHDILVAEGAAAESYREDENDAQFHNVGTRPSANPLPPCAEILHYGPELKRIWQSLSDRAGIDPAIALTDDADLHLVVDGVRIDATAQDGGLYRFELHAAPASVRIASRSAIPSAIGLGQDQRQLGVALREIVLSAGGTRLSIGWDSQMTDGFNNPEPAEQHCWTRGDAGIAPEYLAALKGKVTIELHVSGTATYALPPVKAKLAA